MSITMQQIRAARALLGWSQAELAASAQIGRATIAAFESGATASMQPRLMRDVVDALKRAGIEFLDPVEGVCGEGVRFKWGVAPPARQSGEGTATGQEGEGGLKAAWDEGEEDADLDALLGEVPAPNPDMAEMWRDDPELWARLSQGGRETLSQTMFGDCRAAGAGYFRGEHYAG